MRPAHAVSRAVGHSVWRKKVLIFGCIHLTAENDLFQLGGAFDLLGLVPGVVQGRQQHSSQYRDDCNNDEEFYQRKTAKHFTLK